MWARLSQMERRLLARCWLLLLRVDLALRFFGLNRTRERLAVRIAPAGLEGEVVHRIVGWAARLHFWGIRCLAKSLVTEALVPEAQLTIGVRKSSDGLQAHAWVEEAGTPIGESQVSGDGFSALRRQRSTGAGT